MKTYRVGLIGTGSIATGVHIPGILSCPNLELVAICDSNPEALEETSKKFGISKEYCFTNYQDLIACPEVDAIDITTSNDAHFEIAMAAVAAKKPYALEKPVTLNKADAAILADATAKAGLANMVCFSYRFIPAARYAKDIIQRGLLGKLHHINMQYLQAWGNLDIPMRWRFQKALAGSGVLGDLGCHAIDLVRFITEKEYTAVCGQATTITKMRKLPDGEGEGEGVVDVDDVCNYMADMEDGLSATFQASRFSYGRGNYQRLEIYGSKGALVYALDEEPHKNTLSICMGEPMRETNTFTKLPIPGKHHTNQSQAFADILNGVGDGLSATIQDGYKNQIVLDAILASVENKNWIAIN